MAVDNKDRFEYQGYVRLQNAIDLTDLDKLETAITDIYRAQAIKVGDYKVGFPDIRSITSTLETGDKEALYQANKLLPQSPRVMELFNPDFCAAMASYFGGDPKTTLIEGPALFVNTPKSDRLVYKYHTEAIFYPKRRQFCNIWLPIFGDRFEDNGSMVVLPESHRDNFDSASFSEYGGKNNRFQQYEIPKNFVQHYQPIAVEGARGDVIVFHRNLVHSTGHNRTDRTSYALVLRAWDFSEDLTLSAKMGVTPYCGEDIGRENLIVSELSKYR